MRWTGNLVGAWVAGRCMRSAGRAPRWERAASTARRSAVAKATGVGTVRGRRPRRGELRTSVDKRDFALIGVA
jgi:hypothetical protein